MIKNYIATTFAAFLTLALSAQVINDQVSMGPGNANMIFYSLENGEISQFDQVSWDVAFDVTPMGSTAMINTGKGCTLHPFGSVDQWDEAANIEVDSLEVYLNDHSSWSNGAFSQGGDGMFQLGWGTYDVITHVVTGDVAYILKLSDDTYKKVALISLQGGAYEFKYANLDGTNETTISVNKSEYTGKNFAFYSLVTEEMHDIEPLEWDMVFMNYIVDFGGGFTYPVTGCLTNRGVITQQADELVDPITDEALDTLQMSENADIIGYDWKSYDMDLGEYVLADDRCYFVTATNGNIYRLIFTGYGGSATGDIDMSIVLEVESENSIHELTSNFNIYPNPSIGGILNVAKDFNNSVEMIIYNAAGQIVVSEVLNSNITSLNTSDLQAGFYSVVLRSNTVFVQKSLIIK